MCSTSNSSANIANLAGGVCVYTDRDIDIAIDIGIDIDTHAPPRTRNAALSSFGHEHFTAVKMSGRGRSFLRPQQCRCRSATGRRPQANINFPRQGSQFQSNLPRSSTAERGLCPCFPGETAARNYDVAFCRLHGEAPQPHCGWKGCREELGSAHR